MATLTVYGNTSDGYITSADGTYANARDGTGATLTTDTSGNAVRVGQWYSGAEFECYLGGLSFTNTLVTGDTITAAVLSMYLYIDNTIYDFTARLRAQNWGSSLTTADWTTSFSSTLLATFDSAGLGGGYNAFTSESAFISNITKGGTDYWMMSSAEQEANSAPPWSEYITWWASDYTGTTQDPKLVITYTPPNTAPTITSGPTTTYASGTCTTPTVTWGITFTATDAEETGSNALTYYIRTSSTFGGGTQVATGTCTSGSSKAVTGLAYNASGVVEGTQTLYLHIYDGALNTVTASSFTLVRRFIKSVAGTGGTLSGALFRRSAKALTGTSGALSGALSRRSAKALTGTSGALSGALSTLHAYFKEITGAISSATGALVKRANKTVTGSPASMSALLSKSTAKALSGATGAVSAVLSTIKTQFVTLSGGISSITGSLLSNTTYVRAVTGELSSLAGVVSRSTLKVLSGSSGAVSGALSSIRIFSQVLAGEIATITGSTTRFVTKSFSGVITGSGILSTAASFYRTVTGSLSSLSGEFSFKNIIRRVKMKGGSVVRSVISGGSRILR